MVKAKGIGLPVNPPKQECDDVHCPFHGTLPVRKKMLEGKIVSAKMRKTVVIQKDYAFKIPKFMRLERRRSRLSAHNPPCVSAKLGDVVRIAECRPISKTVSFVVIEKVAEGEK